MNVDPRTCATLGELLHYGETGNIEGLSPDMARYISDNFGIEEEEEDCERCKELEDALDDIHRITKETI